jgi:hypothetical protein
LAEQPDEITTDDAFLFTFCRHEIIILP